MNQFERLDLPRLGLGGLTLRKVTEFRIDYGMQFVFRCRNCRCLAKPDLILLLDRLGSTATLTDVCERSRCHRCSARRPECFFVIEGPGRREEWYPRNPKAADW